MWSRLKSELHRAGRAAQQAVDESKIRLDMHRARANADKCAQRLGYAVFRARTSGVEVSADEYARLSSDLAAAETEATRFETMLKEAEERRAEKPSTESPPGP